MKRILPLLCFICAVPCSAAQQQVSGGSGSTWGTERAKINANFNELYAAIAGIGYSNAQIDGMFNLKENLLGNPSTNGYVLSSTTAGVRSWIAPPEGGTGSGLTSLPASDNQIIQATGNGTYEWTSSVAGLIDDTASNGDVDKLWSADKAYDMIYGRTINIGTLADWPVSVTPTNLSYVAGVTSNLQEQINGLGSNYVPALSTDPVTPTAGETWYNTTDHSLNVAQASGKTKFTGTFTANVSYCADRMGPYSLYYGADHTDGETTACLNSGTTPVTTTTGVAIDATFNTTVGGTKGVTWDGSTNSYLSVPTTGTGITPLSGRVEFTIKTPADVLPTLTAQLFEYHNGTQYVNCTVGYSGGLYRIRANHFDGTVLFTDGAYDVSLALDTAYTIIVDWKSDGTNGTIYSKIGTTEVTSSTGVMTTFTEPTAVDFGENKSGTYAADKVWHFDEIKMGASQR